MKRAIVILLLSAIPTLSVIPAKAGIQSSFQAAYQEGKEYYKNFELEKAVESLEKALSYVQENKDEALLLDAYSILGISYVTQNNLDKAKEVYGEILKINPRFEPQGEYVSPKVVGVFNEVKANTQNFLSLVSISSNPPFAKIFIDDEERGITPLTLELSPNKEYHLTLSIDGFKDLHKTFKVSSSKLVISEELAKDMVISSPVILNEVKDPPSSIIPAPPSVIPAKAGIQTQPQEADLLKSFLSQEEEKSWYQEWLPWLAVAALAAGATYAIVSSSQRNRAASVETVPLASGIRITIP